LSRSFQNEDLDQIQAQFRAKVGKEIFLKNDLLLYIDRKAYAFDRFQREKQINLKLNQDDEFRMYFSEPFDPPPTKADGRASPQLSPKIMSQIIINLEDQTSAEMETSMESKMKKGTQNRRRPLLAAEEERMKSVEHSMIVEMERKRRNQKRLRGLVRDSNSNNELLSRSTDKPPSNVLLSTVSFNRSMIQGIQTHSQERPAYNIFQTPRAITPGLRISLPNTENTKGPAITVYDNQPLNDQISDERQHLNSVVKESEKDQSEDRDENISERRTPGHSKKPSRMIIRTGAKKGPRRAGDPAITLGKSSMVTLESPNMTQVFSTDQSGMRPKISSGVRRLYPSNYLHAQKTCILNSSFQSDHGFRTGRPVAEPSLVDVFKTSVRKNTHMAKNLLMEKIMALKSGRGSKK
jgi:hypothetical protein